MTTTLANRIVHDHGNAELTTARKHHRCCVCQEYILPKSRYYAIFVGGGGLGSIKFPERVHTACLEQYYERAGRSRAL